MDRKDEHVHDSTHGKVERAKDQALGKHDDHPDVGDHVGEAAGGISGVLAGAAIGSLGGPVGTVIGGIAGAMGGWWTGRAVSEAAEALTEDDETYYRKHYETSSTRVSSRSYDDVRPAYHLGHIAAHNPNFRGRTFSEVEPELQRGWGTDISSRHGEWNVVRGYASEGYTRSSSLRGDSARNVDRVDNADLGDRTRNAANTAGDKLENLWERTKDAASDTKARVDGNPATRPDSDTRL